MPVSGAVVITAPTLYGALRGLETFSQLVEMDFESGCVDNLGLGPHVQVYEGLGHHVRVRSQDDRHGTSL